MLRVLAIVPMLVASDHYIFSDLVTDSAEEKGTRWNAGRLSARLKSAFDKELGEIVIANGWDDGDICVVMLGIGRVTMDYKATVGRIKTEVGLT